MKAKAIKLQWVSDPGHAWLRIAGEDLIKVIGPERLDKISEYSYQDKGHVYLEEDCDAPLFLAALDALGADRQVSEHKSYKKDAPCRKLERYNPHYWLPMQLEGLPLHEIASIIAREWNDGINYAARPYLRAMHALDRIGDAYGYDTGLSIVLYFLSNAATWRGYRAKQIKEHLNALCKQAQAARKGE